MAEHPALAQPGTELEIGGGYHAALDLGSNFFTVPSTATVDVRATNWVSDRWGVAARALVGLGGYLRSPAGVERRHPTYFQMLVRYRAVGSGRSGLHVGFGGGLMGYSERDRFDCCGFLERAALRGQSQHRQQVQCLVPSSGERPQLSFGLRPGILLVVGPLCPHAFLRSTGAVGA